MSNPSIPDAGTQARSRYLNQPQKMTAVTKTTSATCATALVMGSYEMWADQDCYFLQGSASVTATSGSWLLLAYDVRDLYSSGESDDQFVSILAVSDNANVYIGRMS